MENNDEMVGVGLGIHYGERAAYCMGDECNLLALRCGAVHLGHVVYNMMYMMYMMYSYPPYSKGRARFCAPHPAPPAPRRPAHTNLRMGIPCAGRLEASSRGASKAL